MENLQNFPSPLTGEGEGGGVHHPNPPTLILPHKGGGDILFHFLTNSKGFSVLFLVFAMLLMTTIGYVFSYLIPTKQKSVRFPIYSTQAFYIAQSGVEYAIRYASDQGWRGTTDGGIFDINRLNGISRTLGNGSFTINYNNATGDILTSTGQITGSSETRVVRVSNFTPFLRLIFDPNNPAPCWALGTRRARFFITNVKNMNVTLRSFSASWTQTGVARRITRIDMNGVRKYAGIYFNGGAPQNLNRPIGNPIQTIIPNQVINVLVYWNNNVANGANIIITFYTGLLGSGDAYTFNLDSAGDGLPSC
jgi:hypothetical protein